VNVSRLLAFLGAVLLLAACGAREPASSAAAPQMRRLSEAQYRHSIADIFGADIAVAGRFEPELRAGGLLALGAGQVAVSPAGLEQYDAIARNIATQVVDEKHRAALIGCQPAGQVDAACARQFFAKYTRLLLRRPVTPDELDRTVAAAGASAEKLGDFHAGLAATLTTVLVNPEFLFRVEASAADAGRLDPFAQAARLSYLVWNTTPDEALLAAAERGDLARPEGRAREVARLLASPRAEDGVRAFFTDFLGFDAFDGLSKDPVIYPAFTHKLADEAREQTLRGIVDQVLTRHGDYRDLFTTRRSFLTPALGQIYAVPVASRGWQSFEYVPEEGRAGVLTEFSFTALHAHPGRSSATLRGKAIRELLLCQPVPPPPNNVNFSVVQDTSNPEFRTARERLTAHRNDPTCAGCHKIIDPIGLALENFDGLGQYRDAENGAAIDASGDLDGKHFDGPVGLGQVLHDDPATTSCVVDSLWRYAVGRPAAPGEKEFVGWLEQRFAADGYRFPELLARIAGSDAFTRVEAMR
jgi:hypothetical protein